jgi:O-acetylhomoserine/O-acetylserine sulfhydrylase-like pyridoxal-dependent enzyme
MRPDRFDTLTLHAGVAANPTTRTRAMPVCRTATFTFGNMGHAATSITEGEIRLPVGLENPVGSINDLKHVPKVVTKAPEAT